MPRQGRIISSLTGLLALCFSDLAVGQEANCSDVTFVGGYYTGVYSSIMMWNDRHLFWTEDDDGNDVVLSFQYSDSTRRNLGDVRGGLEDSALVSMGSRNEKLAAWAALDFPGVALESVRGGAEGTLDACSTGYWQNIMIYTDADGNSTFAYPVFLALDCSTHPADITETWNRVGCSSCSATTSSVSIYCSTTSGGTSTSTGEDDDGFVTTTGGTSTSTGEDDDGSATTTGGTSTSTGEDDDGFVTTTGGTSTSTGEDDDGFVTTTEEEDNDDDGNFVGGSDGEGMGRETEDDSGNSSFPIGAIIGIAVAGALLVIGAFVAIYWFVLKGRGSTAHPPRSEPQGPVVASNVPVRQAVPYQPSAPPIANAYTATEQPPSYDEFASWRARGTDTCPPPFNPATDNI